MGIVTARVAIIGYLLLLGAITHHHSTKWHDNLTLWTAAQRTDHDNPRALINLASEYMNRGEYFRAEGLIMYARQRIASDSPIWMHHALEGTTAMDLAQIASRRDPLDPAEVAFWLDQAVTAWPEGVAAHGGFMAHGETGFTVCTTGVYCP